MTVRYPGASPKESSDNVLSAVRSFYDNPAPRLEPPVVPEHNLTERTAYILQAYKTYGAVSYNKFRGIASKVEDAGKWGSLEDIHNVLHGLIGGGGHMSQIETSAFDPIFWLRKCGDLRLIKRAFTNLHQITRKALVRKIDHESNHLSAILIGFMAFGKLFMKMTVKSKLLSPQMTQARWEHLLPSRQKQMASQQWRTLVVHSIHLDRTYSLGLIRSRPDGLRNLGTTIQKPPIRNFPW